MKKKTKVRAKIQHYMITALLMGILLAVIDAYLYLQSIQAGLIVSIFLVLYFGVTIVFLLRNTHTIMYELISFATQYGQVQKQLVNELDIPYALLDEDGKIVWADSEFEKLTGTTKGYDKPIYTLFKEITKQKLPTGEDDFNENEVEVKYNYGEYVCKLRRVSLKEMAANSGLVDDKEYEGCLIALYLYDNTALKLALKEIDDQSLDVGLVYIDNYDEVMVSVEELKRSVLTAFIERKINKYMSALDGITKKMEKDKYMVILRKSAVAKIKESKFSILEDVKTVNIGNEIAVTLSIGMGLDGLTYAQNYEFARAAIDIALGRGGDQAVIKTPDTVNYFGGKSQQIEKNTRVKARVKAHALMEIISSKDQVFIMGHRLGDVDSFGASVGVYRIAKTLDRKAHIVLDTVTKSMQPMVDLFLNNPEYEEDMILSSQKAMEEIGNNAVIVIVDVNKPSITECADLIKMCKSIVVIDHHRQGTEVIENATLSYIETYASSASEMVSEILQYTTDNIRIRNEEADCLYSGIMVDTNNFVQKTGVRTFEAAAFLRRNGADVTRVRKMFREEVGDYKAKADCVNRAEIYKNQFAISTCESEGVLSPTVVGAQAANELLNIKGVKASFVFTYYQNIVYISARSIDEVNVQIIMEKMGGGGHMSIAGSQLENTNIEDAVGRLKTVLNNMEQEGEL